MRSAYETPSRPCPYCGSECDADWCDVGVGMIQSGPYHCVECLAVECGPFDEKRDDFDPKTGWFKPGSEPGSSANVGIDGRPIGYKEADTLYRASRFETDLLHQGFPRLGGEGGFREDHKRDC